MMDSMKRIFLVILLPMLAPGLTTGDETNYGVFVFGDLTGRTVPGIYERVVAECNRLQPAFALTVGDHIWDGTASIPELNRRWDNSATGDGRANGKRWRQ